jgi:hypothetical protein
MAEAPTQQKGPPLKYTLTHYRKPQHTHEAFIKWLVEEHLPLALPVLKKHGVLGYSLVSSSYCDFETPELVMPDTASSSSRLLFSAPH